MKTPSGDVDARECARCRVTRRTYRNDRARWRRHRSRCGGAWRPDRRRREGRADGSRMDGHDRFAVGPRTMGIAPCVPDDAVVRFAQGAPRRSASRGRRRHGRHRRVHVGRRQDHLARALHRGAGGQHCPHRRSSVADALDADAGRRVALAAAPRLTGTVSIHREQGDLWLAREDAGASAGLAAGITELDASAQLQDDAFSARATFRSARGGSADATLTIDAEPNAPPGRLSPTAPLALTLVADLTSLAILQPWAGTTAVVDGRVHLDLAAKGTMRDAPLTGTVRGPISRSSRAVRPSFQERQHQRTSCQPPGHAGRACILRR